MKVERSTKKRFPSGLVRGSKPPEKRAGVGRAQLQDTGDLSGDSSRLTATQREVLSEVASHAATLSRDAHEALVARITKLGFPASDVERCVDLVRNAPITINFNPDKKLAASLPGGGDRVIDAYLADSSYRNTFETGITDGVADGFDATNYPKDRDQWERTLFRGAYHRHALVHGERPRYAAANVASLVRGGAPRYGKCYFVLKPSVRDRSTITPLDGSFCTADQVGNFKDVEHVLLGMQDLDFWWLLHATKGKPSAYVDRDFIETQVHGPIEFDKDVESLAASERYIGTPYEAKLQEFARKNRIPLTWYRETG